MKFKIKKEELLKGLRRIQGVVGRTNTMPILSNMLITADKDGLEMTATDLEIGLKGRYQAEVETPGSIVVPACWTIAITPVEKLPLKLASPLYSAVMG